jgi:hypothetical protein
MVAEDGTPQEKENKEKRHIKDAAAVVESLT